MCDHRQSTGPKGTKTVKPSRFGSMSMVVCMIFLSYFHIFFGLTFVTGLTDGGLFPLWAASLLDSGSSTTALPGFGHGPWLVDDPLVVPWLAGKRPERVVHWPSQEPKLEILEVSTVYDAYVAVMYKGYRKRTMSSLRIPSVHSPV